MPEPKKKKLVEKPIEAPTLPKKQKTLKQRIDEVVDKYHDTDDLKKQIFVLVQHVLYPEQFCPECEDRLFFNAAAANYSCPNCGYESRPQTPQQSAAGPRRAPLGKVPEKIERAIQKVENIDKRTTIATKKGKTIRQLVDQMGGGALAPTKEDEKRVRRDPNVGGDINWV